MPNIGAYGAEQGSIRYRMFPREHTGPNKGAYGAKQGNIGCCMFPCSDWATTPILENMSDSLGDIERVKT